MKRMLLPSLVFLLCLAMVLITKAGEERAQTIEGQETGSEVGAFVACWVSTGGETAEIVYKNTQYGFDFVLPSSWKGFTIVTGKWEGLSLEESTSGQVVETGPIVSIRHPLWNAANPRQDIPVMVFTIGQWKALTQEKFHIGAAPVGPRELGRNSRYVFALPARYNFAFPTGYQEVENILNTNPLKPTENFRQ